MIVVQLDCVAERKAILRHLIRNIADDFAQV